MKNLLEKLYYKGQKRIALINATQSFNDQISSLLNDIIIDTEIDPRCPYGFVIVFVKSINDIELYTPIVIHNLIADGILWFCYPKKTSDFVNPEIDRDHGWKELNSSGFYNVGMVSIDEDWSGIRFRNHKYINSTTRIFSK